ncbi:unnamed protein product [Rotaria socialis]|uniref:Uncharacterized protein n=1 Tax=Rotaria socialis TaxID=392032 RepID=A0A818L2L9_9BILA|nr:unnamed protein product [Rotaria socialis]CAF3458462.1 unnamed protein product [Rotaria socialis]CAF3563194.1 unnamed protein product [Rotaria socialis]CAF3749806.1 unnamed protein product [Rotaria socialis]CAF4102453.1 unnamed protein product [Rotaria socialis]
MPLLDTNAIALLHTLLTTNSLSRLSTLCASLQAPIEHILSIVAAHPFVFARLRATDTPGDDRIAVVLDLTNCTFYARPPNGCTKDIACPYLHLCPSVVLPNRRCQRPHDCPLSHSLDTEHNRRVIIERGLENLPQKTLIMLILASADPSKTFAVCHHKPKPCRESNCDDLHLCYFYMCSPHLCKYGDCKAGHSLMTQRNIDYLERRGLAHIEPIDVVALFRIVDENKKRSHFYRYQLEQHQQQQQPQPMMIMTLMMDEHGQHQTQPMIMF